MKVGEDPYDPWNPFVPDVEPYLRQPIPHFGSDSEPKQTGHQPNTQPTNEPVLLKAGEDIHDPWNICDQLHRFMICNNKSCRLRVAVMLILETLCNSRCGIICCGDSVVGTV